MGSLVWRPEELPVIGAWQPDGPSIPVEFARQSDNGRMTLVVVASQSVSLVLWAALNVATLDDGRRVLSMREGPGVNLSRVAFWSHGARSDRPETDAIGAWAEAKGFAAVIWSYP